MLPLSFSHDYYLQTYPTQTLHFFPSYFFSIPGVASSPGRPTIELSSRMVGTDMQDGVTDEINLKWLVPQDDGGFPITGKGVSVYKARIVFVIYEIFEKTPLFS